jgi:hypothetical protein
LPLAFFLLSLLDGCASVNQVEVKIKIEEEEDHFAWLSGA